MKKYMIALLVLVAGIGLAGAGFLVVNHGDKTGGDVTKEDLYAAVQNYMEWGLYEQFADYYFNYESEEQTEHYYQEASVEEIYSTLQKIYDISFDYDNIQMTMENENVRLRIPVVVMNRQYQYEYVGEEKESKTFKFNQSCLYDENGEDIFVDMDENLDIVVEAENGRTLSGVSSLQEPDEEYVAYCYEYDFLNKDEYLSGDELTEGTYYRAGDHTDSDFYRIENNQIAVPEQEGNLWTYKTVKEGNQNCLYYGYSLGATGVSGGYQVEYTQDTLVASGQEYIRE
jgi:hypothetical protein